MTQEFKPPYVSPADMAHALRQQGFALMDAAGVAHGTVYTYFDTKEDVLLAVLEAVRGDLHAAMTVPAVSWRMSRLPPTRRGGTVVCSPGSPGARPM